MAGVAGPGDVVVDGVGLGELGPHVDEDDVVLLDEGAIFGQGFVVGVGAVGVDGDDGAVVGE